MNNLQYPQLMPVKCKRYARLDVNQQMDQSQPCCNSNPHQQVISNNCSNHARSTQPVISNLIKNSNLTLDQKVVLAQKKIQSSQKQLKCCSVFLMIVGVLGVGSSINSYLNSSIWASFISQTGELPFGKSQKQIDELLRNSNSSADSISRQEFQLFNLLQGVSMISFLLALLVFFVGFWGKKSSQKLKVQFAERSFRKTFVALVLFLVCYVTVKKQSKEFKSIAQEIKMKLHPEEATIIEEDDEQKEPMRHKKHNRNHHRNLQGQFHGPFMHAHQLRIQNPEFMKGEFNQEIKQFMEEINNIENDMNSDVPQIQVQIHQEIQEPYPFDAQKPLVSREEAYRMFAPKLWKAAQSEGKQMKPPKVESDIQNKKWPTKTGTCPVMIVMIVSIVYMLVLQKTLSKALQQQKIFQKAKQILKSDIEQNIRFPKLSVAPQGKKLEIHKSNVDQIQNENIQIFKPSISSQQKNELEENLKKIDDNFDYSLEEPLIETKEDKKQFQNGNYIISEQNQMV